MTQHPAVPSWNDSTARRVRTAAACTLVGALALSAVGIALPATAAVSPDADILLNEVYGGGGNSGATFANDFVELVNTGETAFDLGGWSLQYASATGSSWSNKLDLSGSVDAGETFLIQLAGGSNGGPALPAADQTGSLNLSGSGGKIALVNNTTALTGASGNANATASVVDFVGWGSTASDYAGASPAPGTSNAQSVSRNADHVNTADNGADFTAGVPTPEGTAGGTPNPQPTSTNSPSPSPSPTSTASPSPTTPTVREISAIQGTGDSSPLTGQTVTTEGIVTARYAAYGNQTGYVIQTGGSGGTLDSTHAASDALFVSSSATVGAVAVGDSIRVTGTVAEQFGVTRLIVAAGGAQKLAEPLAPVTPATVAWPADAPGRELIESMLVQPQGTFTVSDTYSTNQYGEVGLAAGTEPLRQPTDAADAGSDAAAAIAADNFARGVILDDGASTDFLAAANSAQTPPYISLGEPVVVGGTASFTKPVVVHYDFSAWRFLPTEQVVGDGTGANDGVTFSNPRTAAPERVGGDLSIASFNVLNYFTTLGTDTSTCRSYTPVNGQENSVRTGCSQRGAWDAADFARQQDKIVAAIEALDASVVGLMEIENSLALGEEADEATASLVEALNAAAGSPKWAYVESSDELPAASLQDVITNAIIYQPALATPVGEARALGDKSDAGEAFDQAREPIAQIFEPADGGEEFLFVVNHFKSKGSAATTAPGDQAANSDGQGASNLTRVRQAEALRDWVEEIQGDTDAVALVGDFNSYGQEDPLQVLYAAGYTNAEAAFELGESSYSFDGLAGSLDHVLLNEAALDRATGADIWNINSGESIALEYSRYGYHGTTFYADDVYRSSDHDPLKVGLAAGAFAPIELTLLGINDFHGRIDANTVKFAGTIEQLRAEADGPSLFLSVGDNIGASLFASSYFDDEPTLDVLDALELNASAVGNHEFDKGFDDLTGRVSSSAAFDYLGANVYLQGTATPALQEYETFEIDGLTVGIIGAVTEETGSLVSPGGIADIEFGDPVDAVNRVAAELSDGDTANGEADVIVALYHEGASAGETETTTLDAELAKGGDFARIVQETDASVGAIFTGHTHKKYAWSAPVPGEEGVTRPILQTGSYGENIGEIVLTIDPESGDVLAHTERNVARTKVDDATLVASYPRVADVKQIVDATLAEAKKVGNVKVAEVGSDITTAFAGGSFVNGVWTGGTRDNRAGESSLGNLVAEALRSSMAELPNGAEIGVTNPGGLRAELYDTQAEFGGAAVAGLQDGDISFSQALAVLPFNNTTTLVTMTGAQFIELLEQQWQRNADGTVPSRAYLQLGLSENVTYTYDDTRAEGDRITSVTVNGQPLDEAAEYRVGTLSFLADGGDNFRAFRSATERLDTGNVDYQAWVDYLGENSAETPLEPNYAKHAVKVTGQTTAPAGSNVEFTVSNLNLTSLGTPETTQLQVWLGDELFGTVPVTGGTAQVSVPLPADAEEGETGDVVLVSEVAGTEVTVPVAVAADVEEPGTGGTPPPAPTAPGGTPPTPTLPGGTPPAAGVQIGGTWADVSLSGSGRVEQGGRLAVTVSGLAPGQQIAATLFSDPIVVTGIPAANAAGVTSFSIAIPSDFALGAHRLVITAAGQEQIVVGVSVVSAGALAVTGSELPLGIALAGAMLLVAGGLVFVTRRRTARAS